MKQVSLTLATAVLLLGIGPALACQGDEVFYEENFDEQDAWETDGDTVKIEGGKLILSPPPGKSFGQVTFDEIFDDVDLCASMTSIKAPNVDMGNSLVFWWKDWENNYRVTLTPSGSFMVGRLTRGRLLRPVNWTKNADIKTGEGAVNNLRVVLVGKRAKIFINGKQAASFKGRPPKDGSFVGVSAASPESGRTIVAYDNFKATLPTDVVAARQSTPTVRDESQKSQLIKAARAAGMRTTTLDTSASRRPSP